MRARTRDGLCLNIFTPQQGIFLTILNYGDKDCLYLLFLHRLSLIYYF